MNIIDLDSVVTISECVMNNDPHLGSVSNLLGGGDNVTIHKWGVWT